MQKRVLWIEDDFYAVKGLLRPLELEGFRVESATSALEGYAKAHQWKSYDLIVVDLILPLSDDAGNLPDIVRGWKTEQYAGVGLLKWLLNDLKVECPVLLLSVVRDPVKTFHLEHPLLTPLPKRGLLPTRVKDEVHRILGLEK